MTAPSGDGSGEAGGSSPTPPPAPAPSPSPEPQPDSPPADEAPGETPPSAPPEEGEPGAGAPPGERPQEQGTGTPGSESEEKTPTPEREAGARDDLPREEQKAGAAPGGSGDERTSGTTPDATAPEGEDRQDRNPYGWEEEFKHVLEKEGPTVDTPEAVFADLMKGWEGAGSAADTTHSDGAQGMTRVGEGWNDSAEEEMRGRTDRALQETGAVRDSSRAMGEQIRRAEEQARAAKEEMRANTDNEAPGYYLADPDLAPGYSDVARQGIVDITAEGNREIANQAANNIANDPGWDQVETPAPTPQPPPQPAPPPEPPRPTPQTIAGADVLANAGIGFSGWQMAQTDKGRADFWSGIAERGKEYVPLRGMAEGIVDESDVRRAAVNAGHASFTSKIADKVGKFGGPLVSVPLAGLSVQNDLANGESMEQALWSNGAGLGASVGTGLLIGTAVGGPVGAVLGAIGGAAAGAFTSGAVDSWFNTGTAAPYDDNLPQG